MRWTSWTGLLLLVAAAGCAGVRVYTDKGLKEKTGVPFHMAKPYLLVKKTGTDASVSVDVIYLPDLERPYYAAQRTGIGKSQLTVKLTNGMLTEFGEIADSKAAEFTKALTDGLKSIAEAFKTMREAELLRVRAAAARESARLRRMADGISQVATQQAGPEKANTERWSETLRSEAEKLGDPSLFGNEEQVAETLETLLKDLDQAGAPDTWRRELREIIARLRALARTWGESTFELYEFRMKDGQTTLVRVKLP